MEYPLEKTLGHLSNRQHPRPHCFFALLEEPACRRFGTHQGYLLLKISALGFNSSKRIPNPLWITPAIEHAKHHGFAGNYSIIHGIGKSPRDQSMKAKDNSMDASMKNQLIDFSK